MAMLVLSVGILMAQLDAGIANLALPVITRALSVSAATSVLIVNAYQVSVAISILPLAALGDAWGYRRIYLGGLATFTVASLICAFSGSFYLLVAGRVLQGLGAAGMMSVNMTLVREIYPPDRLGRALGVTGMVVATSSALGPGVAAAILALGSWPWLFLVNVPLGLIAATMGLVCLPPNRVEPRRIDGVSVVLNGLVFGLLVLGVDRPGHGNPRDDASYALLCVALAASFGVLLVRRQLTQAYPLLPVDLLRLPRIGLSLAASTCAFIAQALALVALPFFMHDVLGLSAAQTGLRMMAWPLATALVAPVAGYLSDRFPRHLPAGLLGGAGLTMVAIGLVLISRVSAQVSLIDAGWRMALCGAGFACFTAPNIRTIVASSPRSRGGAIGGLIATARLTGQTLGASLAALIFAVSAHDGAVIALRYAAVVALLAAGISATRQRRFRHERAEQRSAPHTRAGSPDG
jgi:DHA2 family multidrug resistance protein-like MFS transporter